MSQKTIQHTLENDLHEQILKLCHQMELPLHFNHKGPKIFTNYQRVALIILYHRSRKSLRDFILEFCETKWIKWLGMKAIPQKSTLNDWMVLFNLESVRKLQKALIKNENPTILAIDATGIDSWQRSRHYSRRIGDPYLPYAKLDAIIDVKTGVILDHRFRLKPRHEIISAISMFRKTRFRKKLFLGDGSYDCEDLHKEARAKKNELFAPVRKNSGDNPGGFFRKKCVEKHPLYNQRSKIESTFHALKTVHVSALKSRLSFTKKREMAWHILVYNLRRIKSLWIFWIKLFRTEPIHSRFYSQKQGRDMKPSRADPFQHLLKY